MIPMVYRKPMLLLHVGWCLPLPTPSRKIGLPTQICMSYPTPKLMTHMLPYPKTHPQTHNSHNTLPNLTCELMLSPSKVFT